MPDGTRAVKPGLPIDPEWEVGPLQVREWMDGGQDFALVDVRQAWEWDVCRIEGAMLVPLQELQARARTDLMPLKERRMVVYCHHGVRSRRAAALLRQEGFASVHSLAGGTEAWSALIDPAMRRY